MSLQLTPSVQPAILAEDSTASGASPSLLLSDTTASAKDLLILVDADKAQLKEAAGADGSLLVLDLANNRVAIGTASPSSQLHVGNATAGTAADMRVTHSSNSNASSHAELLLQSGGSSGGDARLRFNISSGASVYAVGQKASDNNFYIDSGGFIGSANNLVVKASVGVGIGMVPAATLDITGASATLRINDTSSAPVLRFGENGTYRCSISAGSTGVMTLNATAGISFRPNVDSDSIVDLFIAQEHCVGVGTTSVDASAKFQVDSTTSGLLFPRMTTTQKNAISSPIEGLVVYDSTLHKLCVRTAAAWETVTSV